MGHGDGPRKGSGLLQRRHRFAASRVTTEMDSGLTDYPPVLVASRYNTPVAYSRCATDVTFLWVVESCGFKAVRCATSLLLL